MKHADDTPLCLFNELVLDRWKKSIHRDKMSSMDRANAPKRLQPAAGVTSVGHIGYRLRVSASMRQGNVLEADRPWVTPEIVHEKSTPPVVKNEEAGIGYLSDPDFWNKQFHNLEGYGFTVSLTKDPLFDRHPVNLTCPVSTGQSGLLSWYNQSETAQGISVILKDPNFYHGNKLRKTTAQISPDRDLQRVRESGSVAELQNPNPSQNNLNGNIPSKNDGQEFLGAVYLFRNKEFGTISLHITNKDYSRSHLNQSLDGLSSYNLSSQYQLTMDDTSVCRSNSGLRGVPRSRIYHRDEQPSTDRCNGDNSSGDKPNEGNLDINDCFYIGLGLGFMMGARSILRFKQSLRVSMDRVVENSSKTMMKTRLRLKNTFYRRD